MSPREGSGTTTDAAPPSLARSLVSRGTVIAGRYHLETRVGGGGGGTVWRCRDDKLGQTVALKIVTAAGDLERWRREVVMARRIADRNVCRVHDLGETGDLRFVTMELVEGTTLRHRMRGDLPAAEALGLFAQVVSGAAAIHAAGVVHRDLKPENVVVATDGRAVIVDFGLAREPRAPGGEPPSGATVTHAGVAVGTPRYMSPEQAAGEAVDARTDVWALGLIGHELLTGALPRPDPADPDGHRIDPAADARLPGVAAVLQRCLAPAREQRYSDARALQAALAGLGDRRRSRRGLAAAIGLAGAAMIAAAVALVARTEGPPRAGPGSTARSIDGAGDGAGSAVRRAMSASTGEAELFPILADPGRWPGEAPVSVAIARDGKRFAYTTAGGALLVRQLAPGAEPERWTAPIYRPRPDRYGDTLVTMWCAGWFSDDSLAVIGTTFRDEYHLFRVHADGRSDLLHSQRARFAAAVARDDRVVIGIPGDGVFLLAPGRDPDQILSLGRGEQALAIAVSPDGRRVAVLRQPATGEATLQIVAPGDGTARAVWSGQTSARHDTLLVWADDAEVAFTRRDPTTGATTIYALDADNPAALRARGTGTGYGAGSAAAGTVLMLRTAEQVSVQIAGTKVDALAPVEANVAASRVAGWTSDGRLVFALGAPGRVVRAVPGRGAEPWPGTRDGVEIPDTVIGDSVIAHRLDPAAPRSSQVVVERIDPAGRHSELARLPADRLGDTLVRCAGDRAAPCMLQDITGDDVRWIEIDPATGARGRVLHSRGIGGTPYRDAALSPDGQSLAIVEGTSDLIVVPDLAVAGTQTYPAGGHASLQSVAFAPGGDIWATSIGFQGRPFGLMVFQYRPKWRDYSWASRRGSSYRDALRWFSRPTVSPDGAQVAVEVRELHPEVMRVQGL